MRLMRSDPEKKYSSPPLIQGGYVSRPQWMPETSDGIEPYLCCVFSIHT